MAEPLISVVVPVYNCAPYLHQTLGSLAAQRMDELEFVCVDDCSTDGSAGIIAGFAASDRRFHPIYFDKNRNVSQARKEGVLASRGKYIMFLDGDDYYEPDACRRAYEAIEENGVDVLQFGTNVVCNPDVPEARKSSIDRMLRPYTQKVEDTPANVLKMVFEQGLWSYSLWNKIYRREVCVKGFSAVEDGVFRNAEDLYAYFLVTHFSTSYMGIDGCGLYNYCYGRGFFGRSGKDIDWFEAYLKQSDVEKALRRFLDSNDLAKEYGGIVDGIEKRFINGAVNYWRGALKPSVHAAGFDMMCGVYGAEKIISAIAGKYWYDSAEVAESVRGAKFIACRPRKIRTIAVYYHWMTFGGIGRVISSLAPIWMKMGYRIVLITDTEPTENDYPLAPEIKRVVIKDFRTCDFDNYIERARSLSRALTENKVDLVDYNAWVSPMLLWDLLIIKSMGIAFNYHAHNVNTLGLNNADMSLNDHMAACRLMDSIVCPSRVDELMFRCLNPNTYYIGNPPDSDNPGAKPTAKLDDRTIVWCGRISDEGNPLDAAIMFKKVLEKVPDARMIMIGSDDGELSDELRSFIAENGMQDSVDMPGYTEDVENYYLKAGVLAGTSSFEGFPMVLMEAGLHGLPIVTYAIDYLEIVRQCGSIISVPPRDTDSMAEVIAAILMDGDYRKRLGAQTRSEVIELVGDDLSVKWEKLFDSIETGETPPPVDDTQRIMLESILQQYSLGVKKLRSKKNNVANNGVTRLHKPGEWNEVSSIKDKSEEKYACTVLDQQNNSNKLSIRLASRSTADGKPNGHFEVFEMPDVDADIEKNRFYNVLTTKNPAETCNSIAAQNLGQAEPLETGADLNRLLKPGTYELVNDGEERVIGNCPVGVYKLIVDKVTEYNFRQTLIASDSMSTFVRVKAGGKWSPWKDAYFPREDADGLAKRIGAVEKTYLSRRDADVLDERMAAVERLFVFRLERFARRIVRRFLNMFRSKK